VSETDAEQVTLAVDSWAFEVAELPRVLPDGWTHFAVIAAGVEAHVDGVERVDPDPEGAVPSDRHRYDARVATDTVDHDHVRIVDRASTDDTDADDETDNVEREADADGEATTEAFDVGDALDRL
jgi:hypothetical protein